jgi:arginine:ornithine antiporter/lysine permease
MDSGTELSSELKDNPHGVGIFRLVATVITLTIGGGVFSLSGDLAAGGAGTGAILVAWLISGVGVFCLVACFFGLSRIRPELTGGIYSYASAGFGDFMGFNSAWGYWISALLATVSYCPLLFAALGYFFPVFGEGNNIVSIVCASGVIWFYVFLVSRGIKSVTGINVVITISKIVPILTAIIAIVFLQRFNPAIFMANFSGDTSVPFWTQVSSTMTVTIWVFIGIEGAVAISGRAKKSRDVGKATTVSFLCVLAIYLMVSLLSLGVMTQSDLAALSNPSLAGVMEAAVGPWGAVLINAGVALSLIGAMLGYTVLSSETPYEAAEQGVFIKAFAKTNRKGAPIVTLIVTALIVQTFLVIMLFSATTYKFFYTISVSMILIPYVLSSAYFAKLTVTGKDLFKGHLSGSVLRWRALGLLGIVYSVYLVYAGGLTGIMITSILYAPGILMYIKGKRERSEPYLDNTRDRAIAGVIVILFVMSVVLMATGTIDVLA